jgi:hypothetical protein
LAWFEEPSVVVGIIALLSSVITATVTAIFAKKNEIRLKHLENDLAIKKAEQDARRDYEYEARKRLYQECEPILFQFSELSESALRRIYALARNAKEGNLGPERYWLSTDHYFIRSTIYRLIAPMAAFRLLQYKLTNIDLKLVQTINIQYMLAKILYYTFSSSQDLAQTEPTIPYDPDYIGAESKGLTEDEKKELRIRYPERYWLQGLKVGALDILAESLILVNKDVGTRIKSFGEFEREFFESPEGTGIPVVDKRFKVFLTLFSFFHPKTRPVLWRVLITQAYIYNAITKIHTAGDLNITNFDQLKKIINIEGTKLKCNWRQPNETVSNEDFDLPFKASENYLRRQLSDAF